MTILHEGSEIPIVVEAHAAEPWGRVRPAVAAAIGLPDDAILHYGVGPAEDAWLLGSPPLLAGCELRTTPAAAAPERSPLELVVLAGPDAGASVPIGRRRISVGRDRACTVRLTDPAVSLLHAEIVPGPAGLVIGDLGSTNGVFVDGNPVDGTADLPTGAIIRVGNSALQLHLTVTAGGAGSFAPDRRGHLVRVTAPRPEAAPQLPLPPRPPAPSTRARRAIPLVSALVGTAVGGGLALITRNPVFLAFAALGPVTMIGSAVADRFAGRRSARREHAAYRHALAEWQHRSDVAVTTFRRAVWRAFPGPLELLRDALTAGPRLWHRQRDGYGYLTVCTGLMTSPLTVAPNGGSEVDRAPTIGDLPRLCALRGSYTAVGTGGRAAARWVIAQAACAHSPADLALLLVNPGPDLAAARNLPHAVDSPPGDGRDLLVVIDGGPAGADNLPTGGEAGPTATIQLLDQEQGAEAPALGHELGATGIDAGLFATFCRALAPLRDRMAATGPPRSIDLVEVAGPLDATTVADRWRRPTARAVLGMSADGAVELDLDTDGPHVLIAGTTGSGKSELLQTLIATLAAAAPPRATTMLLVDYKGGAAFGALADLPHVVGMLTDLDPAASARALASLRAELRRRESMAAAGISAPRLVIIIDEFATLAVELPEFLGGLLDIAQRGRSLGVHLVLATQRPAGVVSPAMRANISARICLRVTDPSESCDVIGSAAAASISPTTPGRAILADGTEFQTALATAPMPPPLKVIRCDIASAGEGSGRSFTDEIIAISRQLHGGADAPSAPWLPPLPRVIRPGSDDPPDLFAIEDRPHLQQQSAISAPNEPVLVAGPPRSGRSTVLRRLAAAAAHRGEEIIVIDGADGLADLASWPQVSTYLRRTDGRLLLRALQRISSEPSPHPRTLVIDHYDAVATELETLDYAAGSTVLTDVITRSSARPLIAGPTALATRSLGAAISTHILLDDPRRPGHAMLRGAEIQIVDHPAATPPPPLSRSWHDRLIVRELPEVVVAGDLPTPGPGCVPIGIGGDEATPFTIDLSTGAGPVIVTGPRRTGTSTALATIAQQASAAGIPVWWMAARGGRAPAGRVFDLRAGAEILRAALAELQGPVLLVADDAAVDHPAADLMERFLDHCGPGQYLLVGERLESLSRARRGHLAAALSHRRGLLLSPDAPDGALLDITVPRRRGPVRPGRALWAQDGASWPVQIALPAPSTASL